MTGIDEPPLKNYFTIEELSCPCCGENKFNHGTLAKFNHMRVHLGFPMNMTSGYRCPAYNEAKGYTQTHATGQAGDIACSHYEASQINKFYHLFGFTGIGIKQKGTNRFIHLDDLEKIAGRPRPHIWSY